MNNKLFSKIRGYFSISKDFIYTIIATVISTGVMQLLLYPRLAASYSETDYGNILTIMAVIQTITLSLGNNLFYTRLIENEHYEREGVKGDFNYLLLISSVLSVLCASGFCLFQWHTNTIISILIVILTVVTVAKSYYLVSFRLTLNFKKNLVSNIIAGIGYVIGVVLLMLVELWPIAFLASEILALGYILTQSSLHTEPFRRTILFGKTFFTYFCYVISGLMGNVITYMDRYIINPMLGPESVSIYYVATYFAKILTFLIGPISGVLLSYLAKDGQVISKRKYLLLNLATIVIGFVFWIATLIFAEPITRLLYPTLIDSAVDLIEVASIATIIGIVSSITMIPVMKYAPPIWQIILSGLSLVLYILFGGIGLYRGGLMEFSYALILYNLIRVLLVFFIGYYYTVKKENMNS